MQGSLRGEAARIRWIGRSCLMQSLVITLCILLSPFAQGQQKDSRTLRIEEDVQQQLFSLPYYTIFDFLAFRVEPAGTIRLLGQVVRPTLKDDAERRVKKVEGVETVINEIEVLPTSSTDDAIRLAVARNVCRSDALDRYGLGSQPSIRIIVKNGRVALEGVVDNESDKSIAGLKAREINGVFEVKNNLTVSRSR